MNCLNCKKKMRTDPFIRDIKENDSAYGLRCFNGCVIKSTKRRLLIASYCMKCRDNYYKDFPSFDSKKIPEWDRVLKIKQEEHDREFHLSVDIL